jgi:hypothetical protein
MTGRRRNIPDDVSYDMIDPPGPDRCWECNEVLDDYGACANEDCPENPDYEPEE